MTTSSQSRAVGATTSYAPRTGDALGFVANSSASDIADALVAAAHAAPRAAAATPSERAGWLEAIADALDADQAEIVRMGDAETGLGSARMQAETARAASQLRFYASVTRDGGYLDLARDDATDVFPELVRINRPRGPVAVFGASNFPLAFGVLGHDTASALAAGCPVVTKAHPAHPMLSRHLFELAAAALRESGAPDGVLGQVAGWDAGASLVSAPEITAVGFTGSQRGGVALWRAAHDRPVPIPVFAEMGTVNPVILTRRAVERADELAAAFVASFTLGSGQYCTKPGLVLVPSGHDFAARVARELETASPDAVMLTEDIAAHVREGVADLERAGAHVVGRVGGESSGWSAAAAILSAAPSAFTIDSRLREECFGPVAVVVEYDDDAERDAVLAALQSTLVASVMTDGSGVDPEGAELVAAVARLAGRVTVDAWGTSVAWSWAQHHGGSWPATSDPSATSVGARALDRWVIPTVYQSVPDAWLPAAAREKNPFGVPLTRNGRLEAPQVVQSFGD